MSAAFTLRSAKSPDFVVNHFVCKCIKCRSLETAASGGKFKLTNIGINEVYRNPKVIVYPNPVSNYLTINSIESILSIDMYNINGQHVYRINCSDRRTQIDISSFQPGTYILKLTGDNCVATKKIIKI